MTLTIWTEAEAIALSREVPDKTVEIVHTYQAKASAKKAAKPLQFLITHPDGTVSVAEFKDKP